MDLSNLKNFIKTQKSILKSNNKQISTNSINNQEPSKNPNNDLELKEENDNSTIKNSNLNTLDYAILENKSNLEELEKQFKKKVLEIKLKLQDDSQDKKKWVNNFDPVYYYKMLEKQLEEEKEEKIKNEMGEVAETDVSINDKKENKDNKVSEDKGNKGKKFNIREVDYNFKCEEIYIWLNRSFQDWMKEIAELNLNENNSLEARKRVGIFQQCKAYIKPLLDLLEEKKANKIIVEKIFEAMIYCLNKDYIKANQRYYELAVGNSAWPKGEKKPTKHNLYAERYRRSTDIAFILNDDTTKNYILAIKRILTANQRINPNKPSLNVSS